MRIPKKEFVFHNPKGPGPATIFLEREVVTSVTFSEGSVVQKEVTNHCVRRGGVLQGRGWREGLSGGESCVGDILPCFTC